MHRSRFRAPKLGDVLATAFRLAEFRARHDEWQRNLMLVARQVGADLAKPDEFRLVDELLRGQ